MLNVDDFPIKISQLMIISNRNISLLELILSETVENGQLLRLSKTTLTLQGGCCGRVGDDIIVTSGQLGHSLITNYCCGVTEKCSRSVGLLLLATIIIYLHDLFTVKTTTDSDYGKKHGYK